MKLTNEARIKQDIEILAEFNSTPKNGVTRTSYSVEDSLAKEYLLNEMKKINLEIHEDGYGTLFGLRKGTNNQKPSILIGSHYDSVVNGGKFDGTSGVIAALEVMRILYETNYLNNYPIELVIMNAEEGETFGPSTGVSNSRAMMGTLTMKEIETVKNRFGETKLQAITNYGINLDLQAAKRNPNTIRNFIELHIEQGPILENEKCDIGLIEFIPGIGRFKIRFIGKHNDSTVSMFARKDALAAASEFILFIEEWMKSFNDQITGTVGQIEIKPNSNQFVPDFVELFLEIRTFTLDTISPSEIVKAISKKLENICFERGVNFELEEVKRIGYTNPTNPSIMDKDNVEIMKDICTQLGYKYKIINNGTGHDAMIMADFVPTNMIYIPSKKGITHHPEEWTSYSEIKKGADVLLGLVKNISI